MQAKKLTIITVNYNNAAGLAKTFESVNNQIWNEFEYIVIDGGSSDGSKQLIIDNPRIDYWVSEQDTGVYNAMNKGIKAASGDYILFLNSGDYLYNNAVLENVHNLFDGSTSVFYGNTIYVNDAGYRQEKYSPAKLTFSFFLHDGLNHQASFIKRSLFFKYFLYNEDYKIFADWEFFIYIFCIQNESYKHINTFISYYDYSGISSDPATRPEYEKEREITYKKYFPLMLEDIKQLEELRTKRMKQVMFIKKFPVAWRLLKWMMDLLLLFLPKK